MPENVHLSRRHVYWGYVAILAAAAAISQAEEDWTSLIVVAVGVLVGMYLDRRGLTLEFYMRTPLGLVAVVLFALDFFFYSRGVILTISHLVIMTSAIYLVTSHTFVDRMWIFVQGIVLLSAAGAATFGFMFMVYAVIFIIAAAFFAYNALAVHAAGGPWRSVVVEVKRRRLPRAGFAVAATLLVAVATASGYVLTPRYKPFGLTAPFIMGGKPIVGFSPEVSLANGVGNILQNTSVAFRANVSVEGVIGESRIPLYWRGNTLVYFTGTGWRRSPEGTFAGGYFRRLPVPGRIFSTGTRAMGNMPVRQEITLERLTTDYIFALPGVSRIRSPVVTRIRFDGETADLAKDESEDDLTGPYVYSLVSYPAQPSPELLAGTDFDYNLDESQIAGALDKSFISPEVEAFAKSIAGHLPTPYERVVAITTFLREQYNYTTYKAARLDGPTPVDDFLFRTREGHCEYFSSATALMLRAVDVPTRVVNGFYGGEYNQIGDYYTVLQANAHSWNEVYFNGRGWFTFDSTPAGEAIGTAVESSYLRNVYEYIKYRWFGAMARYNAETQQAIYERLGRYVKPVARPFVWLYTKILKVASRANPGGTGALRVAFAVALFTTVAIAGLFLAVAVAGSLRAALASLHRRVSRRSVHPPEFYRRFLSMLKAKGFTRGLDETPMELAIRASVAGAVPRRDSKKIVESYYRWRFGGQVVTPDEAAGLKEALDACSRKGA